MKLQDAIQFLIQRLLKKLYIILPYELDGVQEHRFNLLNPIGWVLLICVCVYTGVSAIFVTGYTVVRDALIAEANLHKPKETPLKEAKKAAKQSGN